MDATPGRVISGTKFASQGVSEKAGWFYPFKTAFINVDQGGRGRGASASRMQNPSRDSRERPATSGLSAGQTGHAARLAKGTEALFASALRYG